MLSSDIYPLARNTICVASKHRLERDSLMADDFCDRLAHFWRFAASPVPTLIVGGGRWGKVWSTVIAGARSNAQELVMAARTDPFAVRNWAAREPGCSELAVHESIAEAVASRPQTALAVVCSRPQDHLRDVLESIRCGLHVLVEKPMSTCSENARHMLTAARQARRRLAVGTEFAFLPALHQCVHAWGLATRAGLEVRLVWHDVLSEARYGATKSRHAEVDALGDLLPHAFSIFHTLAPGNRFHLAHAHQTPDGNAGVIRLEGQRSGVFTMDFDLASQERQRRVEMRVGTDRVVVDFQEKQSSMFVNQQPYALDPRLVPLNSTLRLEWGAFVASWSASNQHADPDSFLEALIQLQMALESSRR
ncbi:Gfo/Idh/MocA family oxidoreductase [Hydrogenophaga sp. BPS33]|uniref:Gfo/Idh/MocA family oxidoreductase n=1 Tax=Hydrogenophaga sp. BPS33 TaxID=2651974 RepID=UPI00131FDC19|nr:Gfo/Idh/MocA family oxidoreductase [Hydrogenophaga sp. BPS33]QHE83744.1 hypothetical protein F9K07_02030 [Hydrogenophaga sp. BPS33]